MVLSGVILDDDDCPDAIKSFIRNNKDIVISEYIQRGLIGEVYFGKRIKLNDPIVLKFYLSQSGYDSSEEAVILRRIDHHNILKVLDLRFLEPHFSFFMSPKILGGDLQERIENKAISSKKALETIAGLLLGITELHSKHSLVHRDLKPGNILIDTTKNNRPIIADLGSVKKIAIADGFVSASKSTRAYLPPESILDNEYYFQSDLYQIGLIMYQLLGGHFPVQKPTGWLSDREFKKLEKIKNSIEKGLEFDKILNQKIIKGKIADTALLPPYLDSSFKRVLNKALHIDYSCRYQNSSEFLQAIHGLLCNHPSYLRKDDYLIVSHENGKKYRIYEYENDGYVLEKKLPDKDWRKDNHHDGSFSSILALARVT